MVQKYAKKGTNPDEEIPDTSKIDPKNVKDADDTTTIAPSLVYSRNDRSLHTYNNRNGLDMDDSQTIYDNYADIINDDKLGEDSSNMLSHRRTSSDTKLISSQLSQWNYNNNRVILTRSLSQVYDLLAQIQGENDKRPINIMFSDNNEDISDDRLRVLDLNIQLDGTYNNNNLNSPSLGRSRSSFEIGESNNDTNIGNDKKNNLFDLDKNALAKLFKLKINTVLNHLKALQQRVDDVSSKVFITGDVNTGKSSFCNSLLQRKLLPEDQLPCTNVFCEILEARENGNKEELHAILINHSDHDNNNFNSSVFKYNVKDISTYEVHELTELPELVQRNDKYSLLKVYIKDDKRDAEKSLLRNGTVDISLIDSPGLNMDSIQTAEVMTRQEEIDLVIFVVNAENQLTLSAQDFIKVASREKKLMFFVIKKFDRIKDKQRCRQLILNQIQTLSPETYKSGKDFIHFLETDPDEYPFNQINNGNPGNPGDDSGDDSDYNERDDPDFEHLENSLRNFVLKKRSMSKLLPAKTFLYKILNDLEIISRFNLDIFKTEDDAITNELKDLLQEVSKTRSHYDIFIKKIDTLVDTTITNVYNRTKGNIDLSLIIDMEDCNHPKYQGLSNIYDYIMQTERFIKHQIDASITVSETYARQQTDLAVQNIYSLVRNDLDANFMEERQFDSNLMYSRSYHSSAKQLNVSIHFSDLYSPSWEKFIQYLGVAALTNPLKLLKSGETKPVRDLENQSSSKPELQVARTSSFVTSILGLKSYPLTKYLTEPSLIFTSKLPTLAIYSFGGSQIVKTILWNGVQTFSIKTLGKIAGSTVVIGCLLGVSYLIYDLPRALPLNLTNRYKQKLAELNYTHSNSKRVSEEVAAVLKVPTREIVKTCEVVVNKKESTKIELETKRDHNKISLTFFKQILERATTQKSIIEGLDLDVD